MIKEHDRIIGKMIQACPSTPTTPQAKIEHATPSTSSYGHPVRDEPLPAGLKMYSSPRPHQWGTHQIISNLAQRFRGYLGHGYQGKVKMHVDRLRYAKLKKSLWTWMKRRNAIEPSISDLIFADLNQDRRSCVMEIALSF